MSKDRRRRVRCRCGRTIIVPWAVGRTEILHLDCDRCSYGDDVDLVIADRMRFKPAPDSLL